MKLTDEIGQCESNPKWHNSPQNGIGNNVQQIFPKIFFLQIVATREDHRRQQPIEEDFLVELQFFLTKNIVHKGAEDEADNDTGTSLMHEMPLCKERGTFLCSKRLPMKE